MRQRLKTPYYQSKSIYTRLLDYPALSQQHKAWNDLIYNSISLATDSAFDTH